MTNQDSNSDAREIANVAPDATSLSLQLRAEIDQKISTARAFPRSIKKFLDECMEMATLTESVAAGCIYALPRDGKTIEGPSARLAEIVLSAWRNSNAGARVVAQDNEFVTAQGVFHDLERNVSVTFEVQRRITDKQGRKFKADMIGVTANAACSIAFRNAVFKGIPKAFWADIYEAARHCAIGDVKTLANKRADALGYLQKMGVTDKMVFDALGVKGAEDIGLDELGTLRGLITAIREGDTTIELAFAPKEIEAPRGKPATAAPKAKADQGASDKPADATAAAAA